METMKTVVDMRMAGGHPCLDFVNTVDSRGDRWGPDLLRGYEDLVAWAERAGLVDGTRATALRNEASRHLALAGKALDRAKALRETLYAVLRAEAAGGVAPEAELLVVREAVQSALSKRTLARNGDRLAWGWVDGDDLDAISHRVAFEAAEFLAGRGGRRDVRECPGPNCGWLFLDTSRGGHRRWCSDESCGTHSRVRRFRAKTTSGGSWN